MSGMRYQSHIILELFVMKILLENFRSIADSRMNDVLKSILSINWVVTKVQFLKNKK